MTIGRVALAVLFVVITATGAVLVFHLGWWIAPLVWLFEGGFLRLAIVVGVIVALIVYLAIPRKIGE